MGINCKYPEIVMGNINDWVDVYAHNVKDDIMYQFLRNYSITSVADIYTTFDLGKISEVWNVWVLYSIEQSRQDGIAIFFTAICKKVNKEESEKMFEFIKDRPTKVVELAYDFFIKNMGWELVRAIDMSEWLSMNYWWVHNALVAFLDDKTLKRPLTGKLFFITGLLYERDKVNMETKIKALGGRVAEAGKMDYVVVGQFADAVMIQRLTEANGAPKVIRDVEFEVFIKTYM